MTAVPERPAVMPKPFPMHLHDRVWSRFFGVSTGRIMFLGRKKEHSRGPAPERWLAAPWLWVGSAFGSPAGRARDVTDLR
jgi:hypothetical protein